MVGIESGTVGKHNILFRTGVHCPKVGLGIFQNSEIFDQGVRTLLGAIHHHIINIADVVIANTQNMGIKSSLARQFSVIVQASWGQQRETPKIARFKQWGSFQQNLAIYITISHTLAIKPVQAFKIISPNRIHL